MSSTPMGTILVVCHDEDYSTNLISSLHEIGANVVGPAEFGRTALALAAQTSPNLAILAKPTDEEEAEDLARQLHATWGVRSLVLEGAPRRPAGEQPWLPEPETLERLIDTLAQAAAIKLQ